MESDAMDVAIANASQRVLIARAQVGIELETFMASDVGRYLTGKAVEAATEFVHWALSEQASAETFEKERAKALAARQALQWTFDQVVDGHAALRELQDRR